MNRRHHPAAVLSLTCVACAACASYHVLPPPPISGDLAEIPVRYEKTKGLFFKSDGDDGAIGRVFSDSGKIVLATVVRPEHGLYASGDGGASWTFLPGGYDFREVIFQHEKIWARGATHVWRSADGGKTWASTEVVRADDSIDLLVAGPGGALYAGGRNHLYLSEDGGQTWRPMSLQLPPGTIWRARSLVLDPARPHVMWVSIRTEPKVDLLTRFRALLDLGSDEVVAAVKLVDSHPSAPGPVSWGDGAEGVYVTQDGGSLWHKAGLGFDAWLTLSDGALYAAAAEPILQGAALIRRYPDLAGAADRQMKAGGVSPAVLREACPFPGRDRLLMGPFAAALAYRSTDGGANWSKLDDLPLPIALAIRAKLGDSGTQYFSPTSVAPPPAASPAQQNGKQPPNRELRALSPDLAQSRYRGVPRHPQGEQTAQAQGRLLSADLLLTFIDPIRLLARHNGGLPLSGVAENVAYVATQPYWDALVDTLAEASQEQGEIALGPGRPHWKGGPAYQLVRHTGDAWVEIPGEPPPAFPQSIAPGIFLVAGNGRGWAVRRK